MTAVRSSVGYQHPPTEDISKCERGKRSLTIREHMMDLLRNKMAK